MNGWSNEIVRFNDSSEIKLIEATVPAIMDHSVLRRCQQMISSATGLTCQAESIASHFAALPAACGYYLFGRLINQSSSLPLGADITQLEQIAIYSLASYNASLAKPLAMKASLDIRKTCSKWANNSNRSISPKLRSSLVFVDGLGSTASYVPPPATKALYLLNNLYKFIDSNKHLRNRDCIALGIYCMAQFLAIHPLVDGNGRMSRILFTRICKRGGLSSFCSSIVLAFIYGKYLSKFHSEAMKYCLTGDIDGVVDVVNLSVKFAAEMVTDDFWDSEFLRSKSDDPITFFRYNIDAFRNAYCLFSEKVF